MQVLKSPATQTVEEHLPQGLYLIQNFISEVEQDALMSHFDKAEWSGHGIGPTPEMKRRTLQYGHIFSYRFRRVLSKLGPLPEFVSFILDRFNELKVLDESVMFDHLLVNEYLPGQGIMPHCDAPAIFGPVILSLSLLSPCLMTFEHNTDKSVPQSSHLLQPRSLLVLSGSSRLDYKHSISKNLVEDLNGLEIVRGKRVSLTFRTIVGEDAACRATRRKRSNEDSADDI